MRASCSLGNNRGSKKKIIAVEKETNGSALYLMPIISDISFGYGSIILLWKQKNPHENFMKIFDRKNNQSNIECYFIYWSKILKCFKLERFIGQEK